MRVFLPAAGVLLSTVLTSALLARRWLVIITIRGRSMQPTFQPGDRVLVLRQRRHALRRGRVVVVEQPDPETGWRELRPWDGRIEGRLWSIKRVAGVARDAVPEEVVSNEIRVPDGHLVVLSDNQGGGDSKVFGFLPVERVLGSVILRLPRR